MYVFDGGRGRGDNERDMSIQWDWLDKMFFFSPMLNLLICSLGESLNAFLKRLWLRRGNGCGGLSIWRDDQSGVTSVCLVMVSRLCERRVQDTMGRDIEGRWGNWEYWEYWEYWEEGRGRTTGS